MIEPAAQTIRSARKRSAWWRRRLRAADRSLQITKAGWLFIAFTLALGFAAINSGSNLLHFLFGTNMTLIIVSGVLSERMLQRASCRVVEVDRLHAGRESAMRVEVDNTSAHAYLLAVAVERDEDFDHDGQGRQQATFAVAVPPGERVTLPTRVWMPTRGRHRLPPLVVATSYPFGLFIKRRRLPVADPVTVYPRVFAVDHEPPADTTVGHLDHAHGRAGRVGEFHALRDYADGDDARHIHWRVSARRRNPVVAEREHPRQHEHWLELQPGRTGEPRFEAHVSWLASMVVANRRHPDVSTGLRSGKQTLVTPGSGPGHEQRLLDILAVTGEQAG